MAKPKTKTFETGDLVRYTTNFLRSTHQYASKRRDGIVVGQGAVGPFVLWNDREMPSQVNAFNLEKAKTKRTREDLIAAARGVTGLPIGVERNKYRIWSRRDKNGRYGRWEEDSRYGTFKEAEDRADSIFQVRGTDTVILDPNGLVVGTFDTYENPGNPRHGRKRNSHDPQESSRRFKVAVEAADRELTMAAEALEKNRLALSITRLVHASYWAGHARAEENYRGLMDQDEERRLKERLEAIERGMGQWGKNAADWLRIAS